MGQAVSRYVDGRNRVAANFTVAFCHRPLGRLSITVIWSDTEQAPRSGSSCTASSQANNYFSCES